MPQNIHVVEIGKVIIMADKTTDNGPFKAFVFEDWLKEGIDGVSDRLREKKNTIDTSEFETHMRNAAKEQLFAMRSLMDSLIKYVDKDESDKA